MDSNNQTIKASQSMQADKEQQKINLQPVIDILACLSIVYAGYEYLKWITQQKGILSEWLNLPFTFVAHPFIILFFVILGTIIPNYFHRFAQKKIAQSGIFVREKAYKLAEIAKFLCIIFFGLVFCTGINYIQSNVSTGVCNNFFSCSDAFTTEKVHWIFVAVYLAILELGFFFLNLPPTESIPFNDRGIVLLDKEEGLYGLQPGQFAFVHTFGEHEKYHIFPSDYRRVKGYKLYKSARQRWFVVSEDFFYLKNDRLTINLDLWELEYRYEARICDRHIIDCNQINLSVLESLDQLQSKIESDCIKKFRKEITSNFLYKRAYQEVKQLYRDIESKPPNIPERNKIHARLIAVDSHIRELGNQLQSSSELTIYLYGKLFEINFQITNVKSTEKQKNSIIESFDRVIKNDEMMHKNVTQLISALHKLEAYIDPEQAKFLLDKLMKLCGISETEFKKIIDNSHDNNSEEDENIDFYT